MTHKFNNENRQFSQRIVQICGLILALLTTSGCQPIEPPVLAEELAKPELIRFGTLEAVASYQWRDDQTAGIDYELATQFGEYTQTPITITPFESLETLFSAFNAGQIDIMAAGLSRTALREQQWVFSPPLYYVTPVVAYRHNNPSPASLDHLTDSLTVVSGSSHVEILQRYKHQYPNLHWHQTSEYNQQQLLEQIADSTLAYTIVDSTTLALAKRYYPSLRQGIALDEPLAVAWALQQHQPWLIDSLLEFWATELQGDRLPRLEDKYFGHVQRFDYVDTMAFFRAVENTLPTYKALFQKYANNLDWRKIAAVSYQESHWNPIARSPTGVRGMMMLTLPTAKSVGVENRLDPEQSIRGGSDYLQQLLRRLPSSIDADERLWFALAAYNIGMGHLEDGRVLTERLGYNPNSWRDVRTHLPLLRQPQYHQTTRFGYARGDEAVHYVENIRRYYETLVWLDEQHQDDHESWEEVAPTLAEEQPATTLTPNNLAAMDEAVSVTAGSNETNVTISHDLEAHSSVTTDKATPPPQTDKPAL